MKLNVPVFFSAGLTERANDYYKLFISWTNQKIKKTFTERNMFDFTHIKPFERSFADRPGPMVLFAAPGMLHSGTSLEVFKKWAGDEKNMVILPGYCVAGTVGAKILAGIRTIDFDKKNSLQVKMKVKNLSFSAHADAKGILQLIRQCEPKAVVLVHGEKSKMGVLKEKIKSEFGIECYDPANGQLINVPTEFEIPLDFKQNNLQTLQSFSSINLPLNLDFNDVKDLSKAKAFLMSNYPSLSRISNLKLSISDTLSIETSRNTKHLKFSFPFKHSIEFLLNSLIQQDIKYSFITKLDGPCLKFSNGKCMAQIKDSNCLVLQTDILV